MNDVLVLRKPDKTAQVRGKRMGLHVVISEGYDVEFDRAIFTEPGATIPWDLLGYGLHFLERWDAAAPLWRYHAVAADVGTPSERKRTEAVVGDLRVLLYAQELLFVRNSLAGKALLTSWQQEMADGADKRLAFLRALYLVKPIFCALPRSWAGEVSKAAQRHRARTVQRVASSSRRARPQRQPSGQALVRVEIKPGVYVRCHPGQEEAVRKRLGKLDKPRDERRD